MATHDRRCSADGPIAYSGTCSRSDWTQPCSCERGAMYADAVVRLLAQGGLEQIKMTAAARWMGQVPSAVKQRSGGRDGFLRMVTARFGRRWLRWVSLPARDLGTLVRLPDGDDEVHGVRAWSALCEVAAGEARQANPSWPRLSRPSAVDTANASRTTSNSCSTAHPRLSRSRSLTTSVRRSAPRSPPRLIRWIRRLPRQSSPGSRNASPDLTDRAVMWRTRLWLAARAVVRRTGVARDVTGRARVARGPTRVVVVPQQVEKTAVT